MERARRMAPHRPRLTLDQAALDIKFEAIDRDLSEFRDSVLGLDSKIDRAVTALSQEFRTAISALSSQLSERQRTPWVTLIAAAGFIVTVLGLFGTQAISPLQSSIKHMEKTSVPRTEFDLRREQIDRALSGLADEFRKSDQRLVKRLDGLEDRERDDLRRRLDRALEELRQLRHPPAVRSPNG